MLLLCMERAEVLSGAAENYAQAVAPLHDADCRMAALMEARGLPGGAAPSWQELAALGWRRLAFLTTRCEHTNCYWNCYQYYIATFEAAWHRALGEVEQAA